MELVFLVCLIAKADDCHFERRPMPGHATPLSCAFEAQALIVDYLMEHPAYRAERWRCGRRAQSI